MKKREVQVIHTHIDAITQHKIMIRSIDVQLGSFEVSIQRLPFVVLSALTEAIGSHTGTNFGIWPIHLYYYRINFI